MKAKDELYYRIWSLGKDFEAQLNYINHCKALAASKKRCDKTYA